MIRRLKHSLRNNPSLFVKIGIVTGFVSFLIASLTSDGDLSTFPWEYSYYHLNSFGVFCYFGSFYLIATKSTPAFSRYWKNFFMFVFISAFTTIGDEIAGTGYEVGWSDLIRIVTTILIYIFIKQKRKREKIWIGLMKFLNGLKNYGKQLGTFFISIRHK